MCTGNRQWLAQCQLVEFCGDHRAIHAFGLIDRQQHRAGRAAQAVGDHLILRREAAARIDHENNGIGLVDGLERLTRHFGHDAFLGHRFQTAGVHDQIRFVADTPTPVMTVARHPRHVVHQRVTCAGEPVEQSGLADVGTPDKNQSGKHVYPCCKPAKPAHRLLT